MIVRIGKVTNVYPTKGKVKVFYEDRNQTSIEIPMMTFNNEYKMPSVGDRVLTLHMENGGSKAFCLGTYWNANNLPTTNATYKKELCGGAYIEQIGDTVTVYAPSLILSSQAGTISLASLIEFDNRIKTLEDKVNELEGGNT